MRGTGRGYGLRVDTWVDERRDPVKATAAALDYLQVMHGRFGSWYLAAAGYRTILAGKMHFVGPDQLHGFEERLTTDIYPADFGWTREVFAFALGLQNLVWGLSQPFFSAWAVAARLDSGGVDRTGAAAGRAAGEPPFSIC